MAIAMARQGGVGVLHRNLSIEDQVVEADKVKRSEAGMVTSPVTCTPDETIADAEKLMASYRISGVPVVEGDGRLVGIVTNRDVRFETDLSRPVREVMTPAPLVTAPVGVGRDEALAILRKHKVEKLPLVDDGGRLRGLITVKDFTKSVQYPLATKDADGRLVVGAAVGVGDDAFKRAEALLEVGVDFLVVDTAHGHSRGVLDMVRRLKSSTDVDVIAGNVATADGARALIDAGVDAVKCGVGPGAACTTRIVAGVGVPQVTAIYDCAQVAQPAGVPVIGDGGLQYSGDIAKAIAVRRRHGDAGQLARRRRGEPGRAHLRQRQAVQVLPRHGFAQRDGSRGDRTPSYSKDRYFQDDVLSDEKLVPEGHRGPGAVPRAARGGRAPARRRAARGDGLLRRPYDRRAAGQQPGSSASPRRGSRRATRTTSR